MDPSVNLACKMIPNQIALWTEWLCPAVDGFQKFFLKEYSTVVYTITTRSGYSIHYVSFGTERLQLWGGAPSGMMFTIRESLRKTGTKCNCFRNCRIDPKEPFWCNALMQMRLFSIFEKSCFCQEMGEKFPKWLFLIFWMKINAFEVTIHEFGDSTEALKKSILDQTCAASNPLGGGPWDRSPNAMQVHKFSGSGISWFAFNPKLFPFEFLTDMESRARRN